MAKAADEATAGIAARDAALAGRAFSASGRRRSPCCRRPSASRCARRPPRSRRCRRRSASTLPQKPKTSATKAGRTALWLGPDEWLVIDEAGKDPLADCAGVKALHSAVGISHRNVAISVTGPAAAATRQCRLPAGSVARAPFRSAPARAPSSARSRSCCCAPAKTPSASNAGARSRTMCGPS